MKAYEGGNKKVRGLTLIEVTLVIAVLLGLIVILFRGAEVYKEGTDRTFCIQNMAQVQKAVRSWANMNGYRSGDTTTDLKGQIIGPNSFIYTEPSCPSEGVYIYGGDTVPASGIVYLQCSIVNHFPPNSSGW